MKKTRYHSWKLGALPKGCRLCVQGRKSVLFVTGLCPKHCYYCPISDKKKDKDVVYINEWPTKDWKNIFKEIQLCSSKGAGITGGDPLARLGRTVSFMRMLKKKFGGSIEMVLTHREKIMLDLDTLRHFQSTRATLEEELSLLDPAERKVFLKELHLDRPALDRLTLLCYNTLGLISFFTVGSDEVRAWTNRQGTLAPRAAGVIHSDIERGFIRAEVMKYDDLIKLGGEQKVREVGRLMQKGKDYKVEDGDIINFLFNV